MKHFPASGQKSIMFSESVIVWHTYMALVRSQCPATVSLLNQVVVESSRL